MASRPRKRKPSLKNRVTAQEESSSGLGDEAIVEEPGDSTSFVPFGLNVTEAVITGPLIAANKPTRKRVPTNTKNSLSPQDLRLLDEDDRNDTGTAEQGNSP